MLTSGSVVAPAPVDWARVLSTRARLAHRTCCPPLRVAADVVRRRSAASPTALSRHSASRCLRAINNAEAVSCQPELLLQASGNIDKMLRDACNCEVEVLAFPILILSSRWVNGPLSVQVVKQRGLEEYRRDILRVVVQLKTATARRIRMPWFAAVGAPGRGGRDTLTAELIVIVSDMHTRLAFARPETQPSTQGRTSYAWGSSQPLRFPAVQRRHRPQRARSWQGAT